MVINFESARRRLRAKDTGRLAREIEATLPPGMRLPDPLALLFEWIEENGLYEDGPEGRTGFLFPYEAMQKGCTANERIGGTDAQFAAEKGYLKYWFGSMNPEITQRLCVFAQTGGDGSMGALWLADDGSQEIVHMGSGSGSTMVCVLADDPVDFLRLLAIGYDEICWAEELEELPNRDPDFIVHPNLAFVEWVKRTFAVSIPDRGREIVKYRSLMDDPSSPDPFWQWVERMVDSPPAFAK